MLCVTVRVVLAWHWCGPTDACIWMLVKTGKCSVLVASKELLLSSL